MIYNFQNTLSQDHQEINGGSMQKNAYKVKLIATKRGERLPVLFKRDGTLHYYATLYSTIKLRTKNRASHTMEISLRAIAILYYFLDNEGIDLERQLSTGEFLSRPTLESLNRVSRLTMQNITELSTPQKIHQREKVIHFEQFRRKVVPLSSSAEVSKKTAALRQIYIKDYLLWMLEWFAHHNGTGVESFEWARDMTQRVLTSISVIGSRRSVDVSQGMSQESQKELFQIIDPESNKNPWDHSFCRYRNNLLIQLLFHLGIRRGELLALQVRDLLFATKKIFIARRPDDLEDPRKYQPLAKTLPRSLPLEDSLAEQLYAFIHQYRRETPNAKKHPFLFVSNFGNPLSLSGLSHVFAEIKAVSPRLLSDFSAHQLRHTWNDRFSQKMKDNGVPPAKEQYYRCRLMGWVPHSKMASVYTKRYVNEEAQRVVLEMQKDTIKFRKNNE